MKRRNKFTVHVGKKVYRMPDASSAIWLDKMLKDLRVWGGIKRAPKIKVFQADWVPAEQLDLEATRLSGFV